jgi:hypothetical protein
MRKSLLLILIIAFALPVGWTMLSVEEAKEKIRQFEGNPSLEVQYIGLDDEGVIPLIWEETSWFIGDVYPWPCYVFAVPYAGSPFKRYYTVEPFTGEICQMTDVYMEKNLRWEGTVEEMITPQQAYNSAVEFLRRLRPDFDPSQFVVYTYRFAPPGVDDDQDTYVFNSNSPSSWSWLKFQKDISVFFRKPYIDPQGVRRSNTASPIWVVEIDSVTGQVWSFWGRGFPTNINPIPSLSAVEAEQIALSIVAQRNVYYAEVSPPTVLTLVSGPSDTPSSFGHLAWRIELSIKETEDSSPMREIFFIDAHTGELVDEVFLLGGGNVNPTKEKIERFQKAKSSTNKNNFLIINEKQGNAQRSIIIYPQSHKGRFYIRYDQAWLFGVLVEEQNGQVILAYKTKKAKLGSSSILNRNGKKYILIDDILRLAGYEIKYSPKDKTMYIERKNKDRKEKAEGAIGGTLSLSALSYALWKFLRILA